MYVPGKMLKEFMNISFGENFVQIIIILIMKTIYISPKNRMNGTLSASHMMMIIDIYIYIYISTLSAHTYTHTCTHVRTHVRTHTHTHTISLHLPLPLN